MVCGGVLARGQICLHDLGRGGVIFFDEDAPAQDWVIFFDEDAPVQDWVIFFDEEAPAQDWVIFFDMAAPVRCGATGGFVCPGVAFVQTRTWKWRFVFLGWRRVRGKMCVDV